MTTVKQQAEGGDVPTPQPRSPSRRTSRRRRPTAIGVGFIAWPLLGFFVLAATFFLAGLALPPVILHSAPAGEALMVTGALLLIDAGLCWLVARFIASPRTVIRVIAVLVVVMLAPTIVWSTAFPDDSIYLDRTASWGESDVLNYQKFPARDVPNSLKRSTTPSDRPQSLGRGGDGCRGPVEVNRS